MVRELPVAGAKLTWDEFLQRRADLTGQMALSVCDGCDGCGLRCMDGFTVTREEWDGIQAYLATQPTAEVERVRRQQKTVPWPGAEDTGATVTYCRYRDMERGNCSVYPARPTVCRLFGHTHWLPCPIGAVPHFPADAAEFWKDYGRFERQTFTAWENQENATVR